MLTERARKHVAGGIGYPSVKDGEVEEERPVCPALQEIGEKFG